MRTKVYIQLWALSIEINVLSSSIFPPPARSMIYVACNLPQKTEENGIKVMLLLGGNVVTCKYYSTDVLLVWCTFAILSDMMNCANVITLLLYSSDFEAGASVMEEDVISVFVMAYSQHKHTCSGRDAKRLQQQGHQSQLRHLASAFLDSPAVYSCCVEAERAVLVSEEHGCRRLRT